jgi:hypothetical protein
VPVTALQALLRSQVELAINGNYRAQRDILKAVQHLELLKSLGVYDEPGEVEESDEADESYEAYESGETGEGGVAGESGEADASGESGVADETDEGDEPPSEDAGTDAPDLAPPPENGAAPPAVSVAQAWPAAPEALPLVDSTLAPPSRRRTPALAGSRGGRRHAVTEKRAAGRPSAGPAEFRARTLNRRSPEKFPVSLIREQVLQRIAGQPAKTHFRFAVGPSPHHASRAEASEELAPEQPVDARKESPEDRVFHPVPAAGI